MRPKYYEYMNKYRTNRKFKHFSPTEKKNVYKLVVFTLGMVVLGMITGWFILVR